MEWIDADELVEVTPDAVRVRKKVLAINRRERREDAIAEAQEPDLSEAITEPQRRCGS